MANAYLQARYPVFLGLIQLVDADPSKADTIIPAMHKFVDLMNSMLANNYTGYLDKPGNTFDASWGRARSHDMVISLQWLLENYPANNTSTTKLSSGLIGGKRVFHQGEPGLSL